MTDITSTVTLSEREIDTLKAMHGRAIDSVERCRRYGEMTVFARMDADCLGLLLAATRRAQEQSPEEKDNANT